jgi:hypothetical protein
LGGIRKDVEDLERKSICKRTGKVHPAIFVV